jgi:predicted DNA-binding protein (MmcQ/YjbR family)
MKHAEIEKFCLSLPATSLVVQWGESRVYKVGGKVFAILSSASEKPHSLSFKVSEDSFHILTHDPHIIQAPYCAKGKWVCLERLGALSTKELKAYLTRAHALIAANLSRKKQAELGLETTGFTLPLRETRAARSERGTHASTLASLATPHRKITA